MVLGKFVPVITTLEQFEDLKAMTVEELIGRLKAHEGGICCFCGEEGHLLLTMAKWKARMMAKSEDESSSKGRGNGGGHGHGRGHDRNDGGRGSDNGQQYKKFDKSKVKYYNCSNFGHFASECRSKKKDEKANYAEKHDDDEIALLMNEVCGFTQDLSCVDEEIMLHAEKIKPSLKKEEVVYEDNIGNIDTAASK